MKKQILSKTDIRKNKEKLILENFHSTMSKLDPNYTITPQIITEGGGGIPYKLTDIWRTLFSSSDEREQKNKLKNLIQNALPVMNARIFDYEIMLLKIGIGEFVTIQLTRDTKNALGDDLYHNDMKILGGKNDSLEVKYFKNVKGFDDSYDTKTGNVQGTMFKREWLGNYFKLPKNPYKTIKVRTDIPLLRIFYKKFKEVENHMVNRTEFKSDIKNTNLN